MGEVGKILYIVVVDDAQKKESFRYTRPVLHNTLQLMGCKPRHAFKIQSSTLEGLCCLVDRKEFDLLFVCASLLFNSTAYEDQREFTMRISQRVFEVTKRESCIDGFQPEVESLEGSDARKGNSVKNDVNRGRVCMGKADLGNQLLSGKIYRTKSVPFELYKKRTTVFVRRETFLDITCDALAEYKYVSPNQRADLILACRIRERKESVTVLLCGTSGCGKSTLSALLGGRLGITTVVSTDSIRHMMRSFADEKENPLLWASTYHAGECLDPVAVAEAKARKKAKKLARRLLPKDDITECQSSCKSDIRTSEMSSGTTELPSPKQMAIEGFKAQSEMVVDSLDRLITAWEERKESVVVEGVHLSLNFVMGLMKKHPSIIPFMIHITNEDKHLERFAVRAKYMTLDPAKNKYVKYIRNIRTIQDYLCKRAEKHLVPKINNTNVDKSVALIHATVFSCLRRREGGEHLYDPIRNTVTVVYEEYRNQFAANSLNSKGMFRLIQRKGSSRNLMAIVNTDGSVAKAWPVNLVDCNGKPVWCHGPENGIAHPMYGPLRIGKAEPINLQFGFYGISAWPSDGGTSHAGSVDESRADGIETGSRYHSSGCSSPRFSDGPSKELKEDFSVHGSDEEIDYQLEVGSDEDFSDDNDKHIHEEVGSVDEESTKSDEEYDDLAMQDVQEDYELRSKLDFVGELGNKMHGNNHHQNLDLFLRTRSEPMAVPEPLCYYSSLLVGQSERKNRMRQRSLSIPAIGKHTSAINDPILSGAPQR